MAKRASALLHGKGGIEDLNALDLQTIETILQGVGQGNVSREAVAQGMPIIDFLAESGACTSRGDARRKLTADKCVAINTVGTTDEARTIGNADLIHDKLVLINLGKRNRFVVYVQE
jgi:tyrosyl-tRNA synthetase